MSFADLWNQAERFEPEPGNYHVRVIDASAFYSKAGAECAKATLEVLDGEHKGKAFDHMLFFSNEIGAAISRESLTTYGIDPSKINTFEDLMELMPDLEGVEADVSVRINNGYTNVTVTGSRTGKSDITPEQPPLPGTEKPASFAAAANRFGDDPPFN